MNKSMWKTTLREIRSSLGRYLAIFAIIALGVGFFSGLKVTKDAMIETADDFLSENNMFDFRLISTLGFDDEDIESNNLNNGQNSNVSLSDLDINDEGNIYNDTAQEKDNPQNLYIPILEPRAFRDNNNNIENGLRINTIDKDNFPNDSAQSIPNLNFKYTFNNNGIDDKKMINEKLKNNFLGAYENNNAQNILTISPNSKDVNKLTISPKNKKYN